MSKDELKSKVAFLLDSCLENDVTNTDGKIAARLGTSRWSVWNWRNKKILPGKAFIKKICAIGNTDYTSFMSVDLSPKSIEDNFNLEILVQNYKKIIKQDNNHTGYIVNFCGILVLKQLQEAGILTKATFQNFCQTALASNSTIEIAFKTPDLFDLRIYIFGNPETILLECSRVSKTEEEKELYFDEISTQHVSELINLITTII